jgi:hypothetical protein
VGGQQDSFGTASPEDREVDEAGARPDFAELRAAPRFSLLIRSAKLVYESGEYLCIVRDVSASGVRLRQFHRLPAEPRVTLELATGEAFAIERVWEAEDHAGFRFCDPIDVHRFIVEAGPYPKRPLRLRLQLPARIAADDELFAATIHDLSREGARIETDERLAIGQKVKLDAKGLPALTAIVCWRSLPAYGLAFQQSFTYEELARLVARLQPIDGAPADAVNSDAPKRYA